MLQTFQELGYSDLRNKISKECKMICHYQGLALVYFLFSSIEIEMDEYSKCMLNSDSKYV
jgi:hypothetical protein